MNIFNKTLVRISTIVLITSLLISCKTSSNDVNDSPIADAGANLSLSRNSIVTLDGSSSNDPDGDALSYQWSFVSVPNGSQATLSDTTSVNPSFTAKTSGEYLLTLVVSDGELQSTVDEILVTIVNTPPVANAGMDMNFPRNSIVTLNGGDSSDSDQDKLSYQWSLVSVPSGDQATLADSNSISPTFTAETSGEYILTLVVSDGESQSNVDEVRVLIVNTTPVANAGIGTNFPLDSFVLLNGGGSSDADGDTLSYHWSFASIPVDSQATLSDNTSVNPTFTTDSLGEYVLNLIVNDGEAQSAIDEVRILVNTINIYSNDFSNSSLDDFIIGEKGSAKVSIENGQLRINPGTGYLNRGYVALNLPSISSDYSSRLSDNIAKVVFTFNLSNADSQVCGACNNLFDIKLFSHPDTHEPTAFGYSLSGGGYVGDRMFLARSALARSPYGPVNEIMSDISNGLSTLPSIGAFKLTYDPVTSLWELYFDHSIEAIDPTTLTNLIGTFSNEGFVDEPLPYLILGSESGDSAFFDNLTIAFEFNL